MKKTKKQLELEIIALQEELKTVQSSKKYKKFHVESSEFNGIKWDATAVQTIQTVADGLLNLTTLFKSQNISIGALLKLQEVNGSTVEKCNFKGGNITGGVIGSN